MRKTAITLAALLAVPTFAQQQQAEEREAPSNAETDAANYQPPTRDPRLSEDGGSLLRQQMEERQQARLAGTEVANEAAAVSFFNIAPPEPKLFRKHELVTIIVRENSTHESEASAESEKQAALRADLTQFIRLQLSPLGLENMVEGDVPQIDLSGSRDFEGEGSVEREDRFVTRITAEVLDVKPNGNLVLAARKRIVTDDEEQLFLLTGICRAEDVTADNTILSTQLGDLDLRKFTEGTVRDATKRGLLPRFTDWLNPF
ncbi:MAG: flagellar basal body L-ring protein FlgH [Planctomycetota bacterium]